MRGLKGCKRAIQIPTPRPAIVARGAVGLWRRCCKDPAARVSAGSNPLMRHHSFATVYLSNLLLMVAQRPSNGKAILSKLRKMNICLTSRLGLRRAASEASDYLLESQ